MKFKIVFAIIFSAAAILSCSSLTASAANVAAEASVTVKVNGDVVAFPDQGPIIKNDRTLVPVRFVAEALGYDVAWDPIEQTAIIDHGRIIIYIGTADAIIDGKETTLDVVSELIGDRTMIPLRIVAETLNCTVDWFGTNRMVLVNTRDKNGVEMSVFERCKQSDLFWNYKTGEDEVLVWKEDYPTLREASAPAAHHKWWIERPLDKAGLLGPAHDCSIVMRSFDETRTNQVRDMLFTVYPTQFHVVYDTMMKTIRCEIWEAVYDSRSEIYPLISAVSPASGTFGTMICDAREVEMYTNADCTEFVMNIYAEGYVHPDKPADQSEETEDFHETPEPEVLPDVPDSEDISETEQERDIDTPESGEPEETTEPDEPMPEQGGSETETEEKTSESTGDKLPGGNESGMDFFD